MLKRAPAIVTGARGRRALKLGGLAALGILLLLGLAFFAFRNALLGNILEGRIRSFEQRHAGTSIRVGRAGFRGLAGVEFDDIRVHTGSGDLNVSLGKCSVQASFWKLLTGRVRFRRLALSDLRVNLRPGTLPSPPVAVAAVGGPAAPAARPAPGRLPDYGARLAGALDLYFNRIPDSMTIDRLTIHSAFDGIHQALFVPRLAVAGPAFDTTLEVFDQGEKWACALAGRIERGQRRLELRLRPRRLGGPAFLPFIARQWGLKIRFDSLAIDLASRGRRQGVLHLDGRLAIGGLALSHPRIAAGDVLLDRAAIDYSLAVGADFIELAAPTRVSFNRMAFQPSARFTARPTRRLALKVPETRFAANDLFASLPAGLFTRLAGIRTSGEMTFHLDFAIDLARPEELELDIQLDKSGFRIRRFGSVDFRAVAAPFRYTAWEKDRAVRSFPVGPAHPEFRSFARIPSQLKNAVMISEDGAFFSHRGFLLEPFKNSIVANLRAGRFVRGASTISMQLVKNLYLRRHKTIARKLEEMLITWLIEENRLVGKERMFEIYLNIIEWGPGIYGAQEAARYYFAKDVEDLTLAESIFMASIIPRPKRFMVSFDAEQRLRPWLQRYYADVARKMLARGWISQDDHDALRPEVTLRGPALLLLRGAEAVPAEAPMPEFPDLPEED